MGIGCWMMLILTAGVIAFTAYVAFKDTRRRGIPSRPRQSAPSAPASYSGSYRGAQVGWMNEQEWWEPDALEQEQRSKEKDWRHDLDYDEDDTPYGAMDAAMDDWG